MTAEKKVNYDLKRFAGINRDYTPEEVERLRGSLKIEYSISSRTSFGGTAPNNVLKAIKNAKKRFLKG